MEKSLIEYRDAAQEQIDSARTLHELCCTLNRLEANADEGIEMEYGIALRDLPRYSDDEPSEAADEQWDVWSWDERHYLLCEHGRWCLGTRSLYDLRAADEEEELTEEEYRDSWLESTYGTEYCETQEPYREPTFR